MKTKETGGEEDRVGPKPRQTQGLQTLRCKVYKLRCPTCVKKLPPGLAVRRLLATLVKYLTGFKVVVYTDHWVK
jgi:hypothetical protein